MCGNNCLVALWIRMMMMCMTATILTDLITTNLVHFAAPPTVRHWLNLPWQRLGQHVRHRILFPCKSHPYLKVKRSVWVTLWNNHNHEKLTFSSLNIPLPHLSFTYQMNVVVLLFQKDEHYMLLNKQSTAHSDHIHHILIQSIQEIYIWHWQPAASTLLTNICPLILKYLKNILLLNIF